MPRLTSETGVLTYDKAKTAPGYTLFSTLGLFETTLVDLDGEVVHSWKLPGEPGNYTYMLPDGHLLAAIRTKVGVLGLPAKGGHLIFKGLEVSESWVPTVANGARVTSRFSKESSMQN